MLKHVSRHFLSPCFGKDKACCRLISIVHLETGEKTIPILIIPFPFSFLACSENLFGRRIKNC